MNLLFDKEAVLVLLKMAGHTTASDMQKHHSVLSVEETERSRAIALLCQAMNPPKTKDMIMLTVGDLKNQTGTPLPRPFLYCAECESECSADRGDYFSLPDSKELICCGEPMRLVKKIIQLVEVEP
jgi:hypothetical protein